MWKKLTPAELYNKHREESIRLDNLYKELVDTSKEWVIISPMYLPKLWKKVPDKKYAINMNMYRNRHPHISNSLKIQYKELIYDQIKDLKFEGQISINYKIYYERLPDGMNIASCTSKFFLDALIDVWVIEDDNLNIVVSESYSDWGKAKWRGRVEIIINQL